MSAEQLRETIREYKVVMGLSIIATTLIVVSFVLPPTGTIDPSVFGGAGFLLAFSALWTYIIKDAHGHSITVSKGDFAITNKDDAPAPCASDGNFNEVENEGM